MSKKITLIFLQDGCCRILVAVYPLDSNTLTFHAAEPGFLTLGQLVDGAVEFLEHIVFIQGAF
jgi:hypothetical protein